MVEEQLHPSAMQDLETDDSALQSNENEEKKLKEEDVSMKDVPVHEGKPLEHCDTVSLVHKGTGDAIDDKVEIKEETSPEVEETPPSNNETTQITDKGTSSIEEDKTEDEKSTNNKVASAVDVETHEKTPEKDIEEDQSCKDKETESSDGKTESKEGRECTDGETQSKEDGTKSTNNKVASAVGVETHEKTPEKDIEDDQSCKDKETESSDGKTESKEGRECTDGETQSKEDGTKQTLDDNKESGSASNETNSDVKDKIPASRSPNKEMSKGKERPERKTDLPRSRTMPKSYGRATKKDIAEKFGGVATSGVRVQRSTSCGASAVKNMLLDWCRAKTRDHQGVEIQNFSSSWSSGLAFCALIHAFFPDAFDYDSLDPKNRRGNFQLAFSTAEQLADCPPLLDVEDMVHMKVPDSKCVYTYVQELYRSLVSKGLVKTKKA
ncbi:smoothelin 1 [Pelobates cultripes]|uniref:Smoothelin 1 n=1 Tax=Pelobates cultripes TaxID=61616 RepID=A0AAD1TB36_PELCU|nr:smoothelin 1 [Pelobates cultripes]